MSTPILKSLKLTTAVPVRASNDPTLRARQKVIEGLADQKKLVEAKLAGQHYAPTRIVSRKSTDGQRVQIEAARRVRPGYFIDAGGQIYFSLKYAAKPISFDGKANAIIVGNDLAALPAILDTLTEAVRAGELDAQLAAAAAERGQMLRKAK